MYRIIIAFAIVFQIGGNSSAQTLDRYLTSPAVVTIISDSLSGIGSAHDLDFVPERPHQWWVLNQEKAGGSVVIVYEAGLPTQRTELRRDFFNNHFMARSVALAMGDNATFCTAQDVISNAPTGTFMGPTLWSNDTTIFARIHQIYDGEFEGSHLDMLHQSPNGTGVAHDHANAYWYFDGYHGTICLYDFQKPHEIGGHDHADGIVLRYTEPVVKRDSTLPSHMILDKDNSWLYIVDAGNKRVLRLKTSSGTQGKQLTPDPASMEPLALYREVTGSLWEVVAEGLIAPCGIDYKDGRLIVSDNSTGDISFYDVTANPVRLLGKVSTGSPGIVGVKIDTENRIWYVNRRSKQLIRIDTDAASIAADRDSEGGTFTIAPNPARGIFAVTPTSSEMLLSKVEVYSALGILVETIRPGYTATSAMISLGGLPQGVYTIVVYSSTGKRSVQRVSYVE